MSVHAGKRPLPPPAEPKAGSQQAKWKTTRSDFLIQSSGQWGTSRHGTSMALYQHYVASLPAEMEGLINTSLSTHGPAMRLTIGSILEEDGDTADRDDTILSGHQKNSQDPRDSRDILTTLLFSQHTG